MKTKKANERKQRVLPRYTDRLMELPVVLLNAAFEAPHGEEVGVVVPDPKGLELAIAMARTKLPYKLSGSEVRALRKAIGVKAVDLAKFLDMTPEHFSRLESGAALTTNAERIFRLRVVHALRNQVDGVKVSDDEILNMTFLPVRPLNPITLVFQRLFVLDDVPRQVWHFVGLDKCEEAPKPLRVVA